VKNGGLQNGGDLTKLLTRPKEVRLTSSNQSQSADVTTKIIALANYAVDAKFATLSNDTNSIISQKERLETEIKSAETRNSQLGPEISCSESMVGQIEPEVRSLRQDLSRAEATLKDTQERLEQLHRADSRRRWVRAPADKK